MSNNPPESLLEIARITKAHGVRGEVVLHAMVDSDKLLLGDVIVAKNANAPQKILHITKNRRHHQTVLATFVGIDDRTTAEGLRNQNIYILRSELPAVKDEIYICDMLGITVFVQLESTTQGTQGTQSTAGASEANIADTQGTAGAQSVAKVKRIANTAGTAGASNIVGTAGPTNTASTPYPFALPLGILENVASPAGQELWFIKTPKDEEILFPAVPEFILDINIDARTALIAPPLGLLELYLKKE